MSLCHPFWFMGTLLAQLLFASDVDDCQVRQAAGRAAEPETMYLALWSNALKSWSTAGDCNRHLFSNIKIYPAFAGCMFWYWLKSLKSWSGVLWSFHPQFVPHVH